MNTSICTCTNCQAGLSNHCHGPRAAANQREWTKRYAESVVGLVKMVCDGQPNPFDAFKAAMEKLGPPPRSTWEVCDICGEEVPHEARVSDLDGQRACPKCRDTVADMAGEELTNCPACEAQNGDSCEGSPQTCLSCQQSALDAGIPLSVIQGKTKLTDHFAQSYIDAQCGRTTEDDDE